MFEIGKEELQVIMLDDNDIVIVGDYPTPTGVVPLCSDYESSQLSSITSLAGQLIHRAERL